MFSLLASVVLFVRGFRSGEFDKSHIIWLAAATVITSVIQILYMFSVASRYGVPLSMTIGGWLTTIISIGLAMSVSLAAGIFLGSERGKQLWAKFR